LSHHGRDTIGLVESLSLVGIRLDSGSLILEYLRQNLCYAPEVEFQRQFTLVFVEYGLGIFLVVF